MARSTWKGTISFGLVNVPVKAFTAVRDHTIHFHQLEKGTGARVRYEKVSEKTHEELESSDIELGYELSKGKYVTFTSKELEEMQPSSTRSLDISDFVDLAAIDPIYYERTYWLAPDGEGAGKAYHLLQAVMEQEQRVGVGTVVMRNKQYLAAIRPMEGALAMSTMRFADEVVPRSDIDEVPSKGAKPAAKELGLAKQIVDALASDWDPAQYHDTYTEELRDLIHRRAEGEVVERDEEQEPSAKVLDLMEALQQSLDRKGAKRTKGAAAKASKAPARSTSKASAKGSKTSHAKATKAKASGAKRAASSGSKATTKKAAPAKRTARKSA